MMRRMLACVLAVLLVFTGTIAIAEAPSTETPKEIVAATTTQLDGYFFTDQWSANTASMDIRSLIHGYSTMAIGYNSTYENDTTAVTKVDVKADKNGNKTYTFTLNKNLTYNDGSPLKAVDYVFSALLLSSPALGELGAAPGGFPAILGYEAYQAKETDVFQGVRLLKENMFSMTISAEYLPYFYEQMYVNVTPYPMAVLAPAFSVKDDGKGAYITYTGEGDAPALVDVLRSTVLNDGAGYLYNPQVTSGAYTLASYDAATHTAVLEKNEAYLGNWQGVTPKLDKVTYTSVTNDQIVPQLLAGKIDVVNKVTDGTIIFEGFEHTEAENSPLDRTAYARTGYGFISFSCEEAVTASQNVRQAIAYCTDADAYVTDFLKVYGMRVYGHYGIGQWMVGEVEEQLEELPQYEFDTAAAVQLLVQDGWTLNDKGEAFVEGTDTVRYKKLADDTLLKLELKWAMPENSTGAAKLKTYTVEHLQSAGFSVVVDEMAFTDLLNIYYRQSERTHNMFYLASNFDIVYDPYQAFSTEEAYQGVRNTTGIADETLMQLADDLRRTEPEDLEAYVAKWLALQTHYAQILPTYPLYSNIYVDFFTPWLYEYEPNIHSGFAESIIYADWMDPALQPVEELPTL